jgi:hypothetical protein
MPKGVEMPKSALKIKIPPIFTEQPKSFNKHPINLYRLQPKDLAPYSNTPKQNLARVYSSKNRPKTPTVGEFTAWKSSV